MEETQTEKVFLADMAAELALHCHTVIDGRLTGCENVTGIVAKVGARVRGGELTQDEASEILRSELGELERKCSKGIGNAACGPTACNYGINDGVVDTHF